MYYLFFNVNFDNLLKCLYNFSIKYESITVEHLKIRNIEKINDIIMTN